MVDKRLYPLTPREKADEIHKAVTMGLTADQISDNLAMWLGAHLSVARLEWEEKQLRDA